MSDPLMPKEKVATEAEFRKKIIALAKNLGCDIEVKRIFQKYDNLLKHCTNPKERQDIARLGITELYNYLDCYGGLTINGREIIPSEDPEDQYASNIVLPNTTVSVNK